MRLLGLFPKRLFWNFERKKYAFKNWAPHVFVVWFFMLVIFAAALLLSMPKPNRVLALTPYWSVFVSYQPNLSLNPHTRLYLYNCYQTIVPKQLQIKPGLPYKKPRRKKKNLKEENEDVKLLMTIPGNSG